MPKRRKIAALVRDETDENDENQDVGMCLNTSKIQRGPMYTIMCNAQLNETFHNKYIKEMQNLYEKMDHDAFMFTFIKMMRSVIAVEETNDYANTTLVFCAKYVASYDCEDTHPVFMAMFKWLLTTMCNSPHIRYRICQFVNMILSAMGPEAALDDAICDNILGYMINRLRDLNPNVRVQAILTLQRLQVPENPDDVIVKAYQFHLSSDPSPRVRQAVITSMGRNYNTIPYILERLWDVDEKVRRHTYFHMSSYSVKAYKVSQRLTFLEQGLNDRSDMVRKVVTTVMLPQWLESYNQNVISLVSALKLDSNDADILRFRKITKMALVEIFKRQKKEDLVRMLPLEEEGDYEKCVPFEKLTVEVALYWLCLIEYLQKDISDELDSIIPELTTFCNYVLKYCESFNTDMDKWQKMEYEYVLLTLMQIVNTFDLGDEIGRENLKQLLGNLLQNFEIEEHTIIVIVQCTENLITKQEERLQFFVDIIKQISESKSWTNDISNDRTLIESLLEKHSDNSLKFKLSSLKVKILDLEEQEMNYVQKKDYVQAQRIAEERNGCSEEYANLLKPLLSEISSSGSEESRKYLSINFQQAKKVTMEILIKSLQISFYMVVSKNVKSLTPLVCELYKDFIRRHIESNQIAVRDWALKCGTAYSILYEPLSKDVYTELISQFYKNHNIRLWKTSIECIFELLDRYGYSHFEIEDKHNKSRKAGRQLYNTLDSLDAEEETSSTGMHGVDLIFLMSHFLDTCDDTCIISALVNGFGRLLLHGKIKNDDIIEKLLLKYFNPITDPEINQFLGVFFESLMKKKKQDHLQPCLLPTIQTIMSAPYDSPLHEIKPETVLRFVIDSTRPIYCNSSRNIHNTIALSFVQEMQNNISNKDLLKILAKSLVTLEVSAGDDVPLRVDLKTYCEKLLQCEIDPKTQKNLQNFRDMLEGTFMPVSVRTTTNVGSDEEIAEGASDVEDENRNKIDETKKDKTPVVNTLDDIMEEDCADEVVEPIANVNTTEPEVQILNINKTTTPEAQPDLLPSEPNNSQEAEKIAEQSTPPVLQPQTPPVLQPQTTPPVLQSQTLPILQSQTPPVLQPQTPPVLPLQTPTTFGKDNTTNLRYLRKSMNVQTRMAEENSPKKAKMPLPSSSPVRKRARGRPPKNTLNLQAGSSEETRKNNEEECGDDLVSTRKNISPTGNRDKSLEENATQNEKGDESDGDLIPLVVSESDEVSASESESENEIPASPNATAAPASRTRRCLTTQGKNNTQAKRNNKTVSTKNTNKSIENMTIEGRRGGTSKRRLRLFTSPGSGKDSKTNEKSQKGETATIEKVIEMKNPSASENKEKTTSKSAATKTTKIPAPTLESSLHHRNTRNKSKHDFLFNHIVTRTIAKGKSPISIAIISTPDKRLSSNKENSKRDSVKSSKTNTSTTATLSVEKNKATSSKKNSAIKKSMTANTKSDENESIISNDTLSKVSVPNKAGRTQSARKPTPLVNRHKEAIVTRSLRKRK